MKKSLLSFILLAFTCASQAQDFRLGLNFNPLFNFYTTTQTADDQQFSIDNDGANFGFGYGVFGEFMFADNYSFLVEIQHVVSSADYKYSGIGPEGNSIRDLNFSTNTDYQFVHLPLLLKLKSNEIGYSTYFAKVGVAPSFLVASRGEGNRYATNKEGDHWRVDLRDENMNTRLLNLFVVFGIGMEYSLGGNLSAVGGVSFHNGVTRLNNYNSDFYTLRNGFISIDLGIMF